MEGKGRRNEKIVSIVLFGFSLFYFFSTFALKMGTPKNPGPGFIPAGIGALLIACTGFHIVRTFRRTARKEIAKEEGGAAGKDYRAIIGILACTLLYPFILETLKFLTSTFLVTFGMLVLLEPRKAVHSFFLALGMSLVAFLAFSRLLGVGLPSGFLEVFFLQIGR